MEFATASAGSLAAEILIDLLKVYTPSGEEYKAIPVLEKWSKRLDLYMYVDDSGNIRLRPRGWEDASPLVMLASHVDTVPGMLPVAVEGGVIAGRGAVDAKGPLAAMIAGLALASRNGLPCAAEVAALSGEEADSPGAWGLVRRGEVPPYIVIGEPTGGDGVAIFYRGSLKLRIECNAKAGHSSSLGGGAAWSLVEALMKTREVMPEAVLTMISSGNAYNVTPGSGEAVLDVRFEDRVESLARRLSEVCEAVSSVEGCRCKSFEFTAPIKVSLANKVARIECNAKAGHSSSLGGGAAWSLVEALMKTREVMPEAVLTMISSGNAYNVTPGSGEAVLDVRFEDRVESLARRLSEVCEAVSSVEGCRCKSFEFTAPIKVSLANKVARLLVSALRRQGITPRVVRKLGTSDMNVLGRLSRGIAAYGPGDPRVAHTPHERIDVAQLITATKVYAETVLGLCRAIGNEYKTLLYKST